MKHLFILFMLIQALMAHAAELPWFNINCSLRNADYVLEGKILDTLGNIEITQDYSKIEFKEKKIRIDNFGSPKKFAIRNLYDSLIGNSIVIFIKIDAITKKIIPSFYGWELSTLWREEESLLGVTQRSSISSDWDLETFYPNKSQFEIVLKNWGILNESFAYFKNYQNSEDRIYYLYTIFNWHPFKAEIIQEMKKEKTIALKYFKSMTWQFFHYPLPTKTEICPCIWIDWNEDIYLTLFSAYKEASEAHFEQEFFDFIESLGNTIKYIKHRRIDEVNEKFILEFIKFMNFNSTETWKNAKITLRENAKANAEFLSDVFAKALIWNLNQ